MTLSYMSPLTIIFHL